MLDQLLPGLAPASFGLLLLTAFAAGLGRGFSGFGSALIFVPVASALLGPRLAVPIHLLINALAGLAMVSAAWPLADRAAVGWMSLGAVAGVPLGTAALGAADPLLLRWAIGLLVLALLALLISGWRYRRRPALPLTIGVGGLAGLLNGLAQIGGPPVVAYWLGGPAPSQIARANFILYFAILNALSAASYLAGGLLTWPALLLALLAGPLYGLGLALGAHAFTRTDPALFRRICFLLIGLAATLSLPALDGILR